MLSSIPLEGIFRGFDCDTVSAHQLGQANLIFGRNGSGKTSLSEALRQAALGEEGAPAFSPPLAPAQKVAVFNRFYVEGSLKSFVDGDTNAPALAIGEDNAKLKNAENSLANHIDARKSTLMGLEAKAASIRSLRDIAADAKAAVLEKMETLDPKYHRNAYHNTQAFRSKLEALDFIPSPQTESQLYADAQLTEVASDPPALVRVPSLPSGLKEARELADRTEEPLPPPARALSSSMMDWLRQGLLHAEAKASAGDDSCPFCNQKFSEERFEEIRQYFDDPHVQREGRYREYIDLVDEYLNLIDDLQTKVSDLRIPHQAHDARLEPLRAELLLQVRNWVFWLRSLRVILATKLDGQDEPDAGLSELPPAMDPSGVNELLAQYQVSVADANKVRNAALTELEHRVLMRFAEENFRAEAQRLRIDRSIAAVERSISHAEVNLSEARDSLTDTTEAARRITKNLHSAIGLLGFSVEPNSDKTAYAIRRRGGRTATNLSEGERNIVSLLYFLHSLDALEYRDEDLIVFIDDPGAALDIENISAILELIRSSSKRWAQTIISTHSVYIFKQAQKVWGPHERPDAEMVVDSGGPELPNKDGSLPEVSGIEFFETTNVGVDQSGSPLWGLSAVSPALVKFNSDYEYAYWMTLSAAAGDIPDELLPGVANTARRTLEGLLAFKCPGVSNVRAALDESWTKVDINGNFSALKVAVMAFMNRSSHKADSPGGSVLWTGVRREDFIATAAVLCIIDEKHFNRLISSFSWLSGKEQQKYKRIPNAYMGILRQAEASPSFDSDAVVNGRLFGGA